MRYIVTTNRHIQLIEDNGNGKILDSKGFQFGQLYYRIVKGKVTFYHFDQEQPWRNDVWSADIPLQINGELYETEEEVGNKLYEVMEDSLFDKIEDLGKEDARLDQKIEDESERAKEVEASLQEQIDSIDTESIERKLDQEIARSTSKDTEHDNLISGITNVVNNEITRSTAKDAEHDGLISGLTTSLNNEIQRAINAENNLLSGLTSEISRATNAENELDIKIDNEITRSTAKDASHDEKISGLTDSLNAEIQRATNAENALDDKLDAEILRSTNKDTEHDNLISGVTEDIDDLEAALNSEIQRALSSETSLHDEILSERTRALDAETSLRNDLNGEITRANSEETRIEGLIINEVNRSTAKDTEHDEKLAKLENDLDDEIARATAAESSLDAKITQEISDREADANTEEARAIAEEQRIEGKLDSEITRSTAKDASHDVLISGLTDSLNAEIQRATTAENALRNVLNAETQNRISGDTSLQNQINAEVTRSTTEDSRLNQAIGDEFTRATNVETSISNALTNEIARATAAESALTADIATINTILPTKADKVDAVASAEYISQNHIINFKNINGDVISHIDATDFIKDGMVSDAYVRGENLVITFNTDSGKENIEIPISDIFNANNYYTKAEVDASQAVQDTKISVISGRVETLEVKANNLSANTYTKAEIDASQAVQDTKINSLSGNINSIVDSLDDYATEQWVLDKHYITGVDLSDYASKEYVSGFTYDKETIDEKANNLSANTYTKAEVDASQSAQDAKINSLSGDISSIVVSLDGYATEQWVEDKHYITGVDLSDYASKEYVSGFTYDKETIDQKITDSGTFDPTQYYTKTQSDAKYLTEHQPLKTINGNVISGSGNIEISSNNVIELTQAEYDAIPDADKDLDAFYIITDAEGIDLSNYYTKAETSGATEISTALASKADKSEMTAYTENTAFTAHTSDTSVHTTDSEKASWNGAVTKSNANETALGGLKFVSLTQSQYDALATKDSSTIYFIKE